MVIVLALAATALLPSHSKANEIYITQSGDDLTIDIEQDGEDHVIKKKLSTSKIDGDRVTFIVRQTKNDNILEYDQLTGDDNYFGFYQGENIHGWEASSGHGYHNYIGVNVEGSNNTVRHQQLHDYHDVNTDIQGDGNTVWSNQQNWGAKNINLTINNDDNYVDIDQRNGNTSTSHTATITLDGTYGTTLDLNQSGWAPNSYTLNQFCTTEGGCSLTVTQN
jgi:hypothetical protein